MKTFNDLTTDQRKLAIDTNTSTIISNMCDNDGSFPDNIKGRLQQMRVEVSNPSTSPCGCICKAIRNDTSLADFATELAKMQSYNELYQEPTDKVNDWLLK